MRHLGTMDNQKAPAMGLNAAIAATLNGERVAAGLTFDQLAERTGISARTLKRYLSSMERNLTVTVLGDIAVALDIPLSEVIRQSVRRGGVDQEASTDEAG